MPDQAPRSRALRAATFGVSVALLVSLLAAGTATASAGTASDPKASASVIGGHAASIAEYPSLAYIEGVQATDGYACTGTVVAPRVILTAGHCVEDVESSSIVEPGEIAAVTGVSDLRHLSRDQVSQVERVLAYPGFDPARLHGDAGLLILTEPVAATPIALASGSDSALYEAGDELTIAGWGIDDRRTGRAPSRLQAASVPVEEGSRCADGTRRFYPFLDTGTQLCTLDTASHAVTTCNGDSGGPAIATRSDGTQVEVGITSLGDGTCNPGTPAVYTRTDQISSWVAEWIDAIEGGGAEPQVRIPQAHIPTLTRERTEELSALALEEGFGERFTHSRERRIRCSRQGQGAAQVRGHLAPGRRGLLRSGHRLLRDPPQRGPGRRPLRDPLDGR